MKSVVEIQGKARGYLNEVVELAGAKEFGVVSVVIFGSAAKGGFISEVSDVDLIVVLADDAPQRMIRLVNDELASLEIKCGLRECPTSSVGYVYSLIDRVEGLFLSHFVCFKRDLLSGESAAVFNIPPLARPFISTRIGFAGVVTSAKHVWGQDLLGEAYVPPITMWHLWKTCLAFLGLNAFALLTFPFLPQATRYAMAALKGTLHCCYFCYNLTSVTIEQEVIFFNGSLGEQSALRKMLSLRRNYRRSYKFVGGSLGTIARMFIATARDNKFPIFVGRRRSGESTVT